MKAYDRIAWSSVIAAAVGAVLIIAARQARKPSWPRDATLWRETFDGTEVVLRRSTTSSHRNGIEVNRTEIVVQSKDRIGNPTIEVSVLDPGAGTLTLYDPALNAIATQRIRPSERLDMVHRVDHPTHSMTCPPPGSGELFTGTDLIAAVKEIVPGPLALTRTTAEESSCDGCLRYVDRAWAEALGCTPAVVRVSIYDPSTRITRDVVEERIVRYEEGAQLRADMIPKNAVEMAPSQAIALRAQEDTRLVL